MYPEIKPVDFSSWLNIPSHFYGLWVSTWETAMCSLAYKDKNRTYKSQASKDGTENSLSRWKIKVTA